ncbi:acid beta-fructofuranosidase-like protein [Tanacetum coccineum]
MKRIVYLLEELRMGKIQQRGILKRRYYLLEKAKDAAIVGILVRTIGAAGYLNMMHQIKEMITRAGKKAYILVMGKPNQNLLTFQRVSLIPGSLILLNVGPTSQLDILVEFELDKKASNKLRVGGGVSYNCAGRGGAGVRDALGPFGSLVLANKILTEHTPAYFYIAQVKKGELSTFFCIDQSRLQYGGCKETEGSADYDQTEDYEDYVEARDDV